MSFLIVYSFMFIAIVYSIIYPRLKGFLFYSVITIFICFLGLRSPEYGAIDIKTYYQIFLDRHYWSIKEPLLPYVLNLISNINSSFFTFSFFTAGVVTSLIGLICTLISKEHRLIGFASLCSTTFFFILQLDTLRFGLASLLIAVALLISTWRGLLLCLVAFSIHYASIAYFCLFVIGRIIKPRVLYLYCGIFLYIIALLTGFSLTLEALYFISFVSDLFEHRASVSIDLIEKRLLPPATLNHKSLFPLLLLFLSAYYWKRLTYFEKSLVNIISVFCIITVFINGSVLIFDRISLLPNIISVIMLAVIVGKYCGIYFQIFCFLLMVFWSFITIFFWGSSNDMFPYLFFIREL